MRLDDGTTQKLVVRTPSLVRAIDADVFQIDLEQKHQVALGIATPDGASRGGEGFEQAAEHFPVKRGRRYVALAQASNFIESAAEALAFLLDGLRIWRWIVHGTHGLPSCATEISIRMATGLSQPPYR